MPELFYSTISLILPAMAVSLLVTLSIIDFQTRRLPNKLVFSFALAGIIFQIVLVTSNNNVISPVDSLSGAIAIFVLLFTIRAIANAYYKQDSLGLGDIKLMSAAGIWLGLQGVMFALTLGSLAGLLHGIIYAAIIAVKNRNPINMHRLAIPAGPGLAIGIISVGVWLYTPLITSIITKII